MLVVLAGFSGASFADDAASIRLGEAATKQWRFGIVVKAPAGAVTGIVASLPVPMDWPEQTVRVISEDVSPGVQKVSYRTLEGGVKQMIVSIPKLARGEEASAIVTMEIAKRAISEPANTSSLKVPLRVGGELAKFLRPSPFIESTNPKIRTLAPTLIADKGNSWQQTEAIYSWVRENVKYEFSTEIKPAVVALQAGHGDCEELTSLFIAFCRANKIPARAVWVPDHCYPEFYLQDAEGRGHWYPCQAAGAKHDFGRMAEKRPILQKGDNFKLAEERLPQRYVKQYLRAANAEANPEVRFVMEPVREGD